MKSSEKSAFCWSNPTKSPLNQLPVGLCCSYQYPIISPLCTIIFHCVPLYLIVYHYIPLCPITSHYIPIYPILSPLHPIMSHYIYIFTSHYIPIVSHLRNTYPHDYLHIPYRFTMSLCFGRLPGLSSVPWVAWRSAALEGLI